MAQQPRRGSTTLLWGLLVGILLALLIVLDRLFVAGQLRHAGLGAGLVSLLLSRGVLFIVGLVLFFLAGLLAARRSGALESGVFAGLLAGILAGLTNLVFVVLAAGAVNRRLPRAPGAAHRMLPVVHAALGTILFSAIVALIAVSLIGAGVGALGGLAGRGSGRRGQPFQGGGTAGMQGYPLQPGPQASASEFAPSLPSTPPMPPGYIPGDDSPTIQTHWP